MPASIFDWLASPEIGHRPSVVPLSWTTSSSRPLAMLVRRLCGGTYLCGLGRRQTFACTFLRIDRRRPGQYPKGSVDMGPKAKLLASLTTVGMALAGLSLQGFLSTVSVAPAASLADTASRLHVESPKREVLRQPTVLRAEVAAPPLVDPALADHAVAGETTKLLPNPGFEDPYARRASYISSHPPTAKPHIADMLPNPSSEAPPPYR